MLDIIYTSNTTLTVLLDNARFVPYLSLNFFVNTHVLRASLSGWVKKSTRGCYLGRFMLLKTTGTKKNNVLLVSYCSIVVYISFFKNEMQKNITRNESIF